MPVAEMTTSPATHRPLPVADTVLGTVAQRVRQAGGFLLMVGPDGQVLQHDAEAGLFYRRFVLPLVQFWQEARVHLAQRVGKLTAAAGPVVWELVPGVLLAAVPHIEKRQLKGAFVVAVRGVDFHMGEDVLRTCGRLGLDATWLSQQAESLPTFDSAGLGQYAKLISGTIADQVRLSAMEGELNSLSGQLANSYEELSLIYQVSGGMKVNRRASDFFKQVCLDVMEVMSVRGMGVALPPGNVYRQDPVLYGGLSLPPGQVHRLAEQLQTLMRDRKNILLINDLSSDKDLHWLGQHATRLLAAPFQRQDQVLGCIFALDKSDGDFDSVDSKLLNSIANESAIYLENAVLFEDVHGLMMGLLHALTSAVDAKDAYTCGHSERVAILTRALAGEIGLSDREVDRLYMAGLLHDVGKIGVPEAVLQKTGRLTTEEFELMKKHPQIGARILRDIKQIEDIIPGVLHHHERYDGKGYPSGLAAENIPLMGRIICLADCFDAMTSNRTYRLALPLEEALKEIAACSGTQFDPVLTKAFLGIGVERFRKLLLDQQMQSEQLVDLQQSLRSV